VRPAKHPLFGPVIAALEYLPWLAFAATLRILPESLARALGRAAGRAAWTLLPGRARLAAEHARRALGPEGPAAARRSFAHFGEVLVEIVRARRALVGDRWRSRVEFAGLEHLEEARRGGRGVVVVGAHLGNWEIAGRTVAAIGFPLNTVVRPMRNRLFDRRLDAWRRETGQRTIPKDGAMREAIRALRRNELVTLMADQDARKDGVFVPFFGLPASTHRTPAQLSLRYRAPIVTFAAPCLPGGRWRVAFDAPFVAEDTGDAEGDVRRATERLTAALEGHVRSWPDQWLWAHKRWKTRPREA
jgi:KDO2-lipid IV(A) lauroyltransferase